MKYVVIVAFLAIMPAQLMGQSGTDSCAEIAAMVQDISGLGLIEVVEPDAEAASDGWCQISKALILGNDFRFEQALVRFDQLATTAPENRSLEVTLTSLQTEIGDLDIEASLSHDARSGELVLHDLLARGPDGRGLQVTAEFALDAAMDAKALQVALPDLALVALSAKLFVTPALLDALDIHFQDVTRAAVGSALKDVSEAQVSSKSRRAFLGFVGAAPNAWGTLEIDIATASSVGILQLVGPFFNLGDAPEMDAIARGLDVALTDVMLDVAWKPGRM